MTDDMLDMKSSWAALRAWLWTDRRGERLLLALILVVGAYLRLSHLDWDEGAHIHPDERFLTMVESALELPKSFREFFDSTTSPMSPYNKGYGFFVYGTLPIFIVRVVAELADKFNEAAKLWTAAPGIPLDLNGYGGVHLVGRALSGLFDLVGVWLIYVIGRRLYSRRVGLVAAALLAFAVLPLQQSHFFTVDTFGTFFSLLTFYFAVRVAQGGQPERGGGGVGTYLALGASLGATIACRINLLPLAGIALLAAGIRAWDDWQREGFRDGAWLSTMLQATLFRLMLMTLVAVAVFRVAQPYAFGGSSLLDFSFSQQWRDNMRQIRQLISGDADSPPGHQWTSRTPFVFPFVNMVFWGMGLPMGLSAWAGWAVAAWQVVRGLTRRLPTRDDGKAVRAHLLPVVWIGGMFLWQGLQYVQSMRYYLPLYPIYAMMAAWLCWWLVEKARQIANRQIGKSANRQIANQHPKGSAVQLEDAESVDSDTQYATRITHQVTHITQFAIRHSPFAIRHSQFAFCSMAYALLALVVVGTMLWGWGFLAIYRRPLTRITASRWMYENVPPGSHIGNEHWDDGLPLRIDGKDGFGSFGFKGLSSSSDGNMQMYWEDTPEKREQLYQWLNEADYLVLSSNRLWGSIPRLPMRYPMTTLYYKLLFEEKLGFKQVYHGTSFPTIFGIQFDDSWAEEAFSVYDHPEVYIFQKTPEYSEALVRSYFDQVDLENTIQMWPKQVSAAPTALMLTEDEAARQRAGGTWSEIFDEEGLVNGSTAVSVLVWLLLIELLGIIAFPLAFVVLRGLSDRGYGVSKTLGIFLLAWLSWIGPSLKVVPYQRWWILVALGVIAGVSVLAAIRSWTTLREFVRARASLLLTEEVVFLVLFGLFLLIRWGNPDLWHPARGGEKPMDFAYLNAVIKSTSFPPYDPWHAGGYMSYYYYGFVIVGTLVKLTGIVPWVAYNLAVPLLFALTGLGAFAVAYSLAEGDKVTAGDKETGRQGDKRTAGEPASPGRPVTWSPGRLVTGSPGHPVTFAGLSAGLAATFFVTIIGNFGNIKLLLDQWAMRSTIQFESTIPGLAKLVRGVSGAWMWLTGKAPLNFPNDWWFWNASRVIPETINEFPFFTFTYADLHAHMIALPLTLLGLATAVAVVRLIHGKRPRGNGQERILREPSPWSVPVSELLPIGLMGLVIGGLRATNTWDFPTYILVGAAALSVLEVTRRVRMRFPITSNQRIAFLFRAVVAVLWRSIIMLAVAVVTFYPYAKYYATAYAGLERWKDATTEIPDYLTVFGFFLAAVTIYLVTELATQLREQQMTVWLRRATPTLVVVTAGLLAAAWVAGIHIWAVALPLFVLAGLLVFGRDIPPARRLGLLLIALALAITMGVEVVRQKDDIGRMNTVFKFYMQAWVLFGVGSAFGLASWAERAREWAPGLRRLVAIVLVVLFVGAMIYPPTAARAKVRDRFSPEASPHGLDGMAYMDQAHYFDNDRDMRLADDKAAILWMLRTVPGSPVILEGNTPGYRWGSRFSIYTGLPAVQGWDWHQKQQRSVVPSTVIDRRLGHVREIYDTTDLSRARYLLDTYHVTYIIVGELERAYYNPAGLAKFDELVAQGYLGLVYEGGSVRIYQVVGRGVSVESPAPSSVGPRPVPTPTVELESPARALPTVGPFVSPTD